MISQLWDNYSSIVWSTTPQHARFLEACSEEEFIQAVNRAFRLEPEKRSNTQFYEVVHDILLRSNALFKNFAKSAQLDTLRDSVCDEPPSATRLQGKRASFPLKLSHANRYTQNGVALIGYVGSD